MIWNNQDELNDLLLLTPQQWSAWIVLSVTDLIGAQLADVCWCYVSESWIGIAKSWLLRQALSFLIKQCLPSQTFICIILIDIWQVMLKIMPSSRPNNSIYLHIADDMFCKDNTVAEIFDRCLLIPIVNNGIKKQKKLRNLFQFHCREKKFWGQTFNSRSQQTHVVFNTIQTIKM